MQNRGGAVRTALKYCLVLLMLEATAAMAEPTLSGKLQQQVLAAERAFARTMAERDYRAFRSFLAKDAIFFSGQTPLRGRDRIAEAWKPYYEGPDAPFSWEPDQVEVLSTGELAFSSGPVLDQQGKLIGRFNSVWRYEATGQWRIVFDKGSDTCPSS